MGTEAPDVMGVLASPGVHAVAAQDQGQMCPDVAGAGELRLGPAWGWGGPGGAVSPPCSFLWPQVLLTFSWPGVQG